MIDVVVIVVGVWIGICCLSAPLAIALFRAAALADEREVVLQRREAIRRQAALDRLEQVRSPSGRRFFARPGARRDLEQVLR